MSRSATNWVWDHAVISDSTQLLVLLSVADHADPNGEHAFPSKTRLARDTRCSERTVQRHLSAMVREGILEVQEPASGRRPTTYRLPGVRGDRLSPLTDGRGDRGETNGDRAPLMEPGTSSAARGTRSAAAALTEASRAANDAEDLAASFWSLYPHRRHAPRWRKQAALKAWAKVPLEHRPATLRALTDYANSSDVRRGFVMRPDRWLETEPWTTEATGTGSTEFGDDGIVDGAPWLE